MSPYVDQPGRTVMLYTNEDPAHDAIVDVKDGDSHLSFKGIVRYFGKCTFSLSCRELDEKINIIPV